MELPKRKHPRLPGYNYSQAGYYFITICTQDMKRIFSKITVGQGLAPAENKLTVFGQIADNEINSLPARYPDIVIDKYVIMPNHIHMIVVLHPTEAGASPCPTISDVVCTFKSLTTRKCKSGKIFQSSFHDHIIRGEKGYLKIWNYIDTNPAKWLEDCYYTTEDTL